MFVTQNLLQYHNIYEDSSFFLPFADMSEGYLHIALREWFENLTWQTFSE